MKRSLHIVGISALVAVLAMVLPVFVKPAYADFCFEYVDNDSISRMSCHPTATECQNEQTHESGVTRSCYERTTTGGGGGGTTGGGGGGTTGGGGGGSTGGGGGGTTGGGGGGSGTGPIFPTIPNPTGYKDLCEFINAVLNVIAEIAAIVAVLFIIWSGFLFISAQGNPEKLKTAKRTFWTTIIGTAVIVGAAVITKIIINTVNTVSPSLGGTGNLICPADGTTPS